MVKTCGKLTVNKTDDYYGEIVKTLEKAGFIIIKDIDCTFETYYLIAKKVDDE